MNINDATDYLIVKLVEGGAFLNVLKLHKLLYYCQAWHLAFNKRPLFENYNFQAWVHGPVSRAVYDRFLGSKSMYSNLSMEDIRAGFDPRSLAESDRALIDAVLESYGHLSGDQLEAMTHVEDPWLEARAGLPASARSEVIISNNTMMEYYARRLEASA